MVAHAHIPSFQEAEVEGFRVQGQLSYIARLYLEFFFFL
jgi:hypothetical protein